MTIIDAILSKTGKIVYGTITFLAVLGLIAGASCAKKSAQQKNIKSVQHIPVVDYSGWLVRDKTRIEDLISELKQKAKPGMTANLIYRVGDEGTTDGMIHTVSFMFNNGIFYLIEHQTSYDKSDNKYDDWGTTYIKDSDIPGLRLGKDDWRIYKMGGSFEFDCFEKGIAVDCYMGNGNMWESYRKWEIDNEFASSVYGPLLKLIADAIKAGVPITYSAEKPSIEELIEGMCRSK